MPNFLKFFQKRRGEETSSSFHEASITLMPKPQKKSNTKSQEKKFISQYTRHKKTNTA